MAVPTFLQSKTQASDSSAATSHAITPDSTIRSQGGSICPSTGVVESSYDGNTGNLITGITDTDGNIWQRGTSASNAAGVNGEIWYAFNMKGGSAPTITVTTSASVKMKLAFAELDQVAPVSPIDGTSSPLDDTTERIATDNSTSRTSAASNSVKRVGMIEVFVGGIAWNDTRTISSAGSTWTGPVQLSGGSSNLGVGLERKSAEVQNVAGLQAIARFTMSASGTLPAAVMCLTFFRDGVITSTNEDGYIDNFEGVATAYTDTSANLVYRSSYSAPGGGTGSSEVSQAFGFFPRFYPKTGATIGDAIDCVFNVIDGFDDGAGYFDFFVSTFNNGQVGDTLTVADENTAESNGPDLLAIDANVFGLKTVTLDKSTDFNDDGTTAVKLTHQGDGGGTTTGNYINVGDYFSSQPMYLMLALTYPSAATPLRTLMGVGT